MEKTNHGDFPAVGGGREQQEVTDILFMLCFMQLFFLMPGPNPHSC